MIGKILKSTAGKPCSCPDGKICTGCKKKKTVKPLVFIEEPRRLTIPIVVSRYNAKPTTVQVAEKSRRWSFRKQEPVKPVARNSIYQWYKRRKSLNELNDRPRDKKREKQERKDRAKREREKDYLEQLKQQAEYALNKTESAVKEVSGKPKRLKARTATAKPEADSKFVNVQQHNRYDTLSKRFIDCCYKLCCQLYCYLSCIVIIGIVLVYFL